MENRKYINISEVWQKLKAGKKIIVIYIAVAAAVGLLFVFTTPLRYQSVVKLAPEQIGENAEPQDALYPEIYPNIVSANDFVMGLWNVEVTTADGSLKTDYKTYMIRHQRKSLTDYPKGWLIVMMDKLRGEQMASALPGDSVQGPARLNKRDEEVIKAIKGSIQCVWDKKTDAITLSVVDQDPLVAAIIADTVTARLQKSITDYRTRKARIDLNYAERLCLQAYDEYKAAEQEYSEYTDTYQYATGESHKLRIEELKLNKELKFSTYSNAHDNLQEAKSRLQEQTPAFTIIQSPMVAGKPYGMSRMMKWLLWLLAGAFVGSIHAYRRKK